MLRTLLPRLKTINAAIQYKDRQVCCGDMPGGNTTIKNDKNMTLSSPIHDDTELCACYHKNRLGFNVDTALFNSEIHSGQLKITDSHFLLYDTGVFQP